MYSMLQEETTTHAASNQQRGIVSFDFIDWDKYREFNKRNSFVEFTKCSLQSLRKLPKDRLMDLQADYYNEMLEKEARDSIFVAPSHNRNEVVTIGSRKRNADNSFQFDRVMKGSKPSSPALSRKLHGTALFKKKGYFEEVSIDIGTMNNCIKANIPTLTVFCDISCRQTQKDIDKDILNYIDMKMLAQVNRIKNPSEKHMEVAKNKDPNCDFVLCTFPIY